MRKQELSAAGVCASMLTAAAPLHAQQPDVDVVALINEVRAKEQWIHEVDSFLLRLEGTWTTTPQAIAVRLAKLKKRFPSQEDFDPARFTHLRPEMHETLEIVFDANRLRYRKHRFGSRFELKIWDGERVIHQSGVSPDELPGRYTFDAAPQRLFESFFGDLSWPRASFHSFWWNPINAEKRTEWFWGPDEDFRMLGQENYRGIDCYVLEGMRRFRRWYVGVEGHFVHGFSWRSLTEDADALSVMRDIAERRGKSVTSAREYYDWRSSWLREERLAMDREYYAALLDESRPKVEYFLRDYKELAPGMWFPMTQGYEFFLEEKDEDGKFPLDTRREFRAVEVKLNEALPYELFSIELKEGARVDDRRHEPRLFYKYEKDMPAEKWEAIVADERQRQADWDAANQSRDALIGQPAPAFPETQWLNSDPLTWEELRGQIVILDFWAEWCGPCRNDLPKMRDQHKQRENTGITVLGIHTPGSRTESIKKMLDLYDLQYPICIDTTAPANARSFGWLSSQFGVDGIPHAFVVDREGRIAGQGSLSEVLGIASGLPPIEDANR